MLGQVCCAEDPVPHGKLRREVYVRHSLIVGMVPSVHLWSIDDLLEPSRRYIYVRVDVHPPDGFNAALEKYNFR